MTYLVEVRLAVAETKEKPPGAIKLLNTAALRIPAVLLGQAEAIAQFLTARITQALEEIREAQRKAVLEAGHVEGGPTSTGTPAEAGVEVRGSDNGSGGDNLAGEQHRGVGDAAVTGDLQVVQDHETVT